MLIAAAATMPDSPVQQYDDSEYSPVIVSSFAGVNVPSSGILNAAKILRNKRENPSIEYITQQTVTETVTLLN